jgi:nicotinate phosphoribosyltransferase
LPRRLPPELFRLPVEAIRRGHYSDAYLRLAKRVLEDEGRHPRVTMQVFQKRTAVLGGIDEALAVLELCSGAAEGDGWRPGWEALSVRALHEGDAVAPLETVMTIEGDYALFAHLETVFLGCLARRTLIVGNVREAVAAARGKPIFFFAARHDHWPAQPGDGFAAHLGGGAGVSTDAGGAWWGARGIGTLPHALIAAYGGDTVAAARACARQGSADLTVLVDFANDSIATALAVAGALGDDLWGVRLDTAEDMVDRGLADLGPGAPPGVSPELVRRVRRALDGAGHDRVRIVVSGGFDATRIARFEAEGAPVDAYGVGSALLRGQNDFTADVVRLDGRDCAKAGRRYRPNARLEQV